MLASVTLYRAAERKIACDPKPTAREKRLARKLTTEGIVEMLSSPSKPLAEYRSLAKTVTKKEWAKIMTLPEHWAVYTKIIQHEERKRAFRMEYVLALRAAAAILVDKHGLDWDEKFRSREK